MSDEYVLHLYTAGKTPRSERAITNLQRLCVQDLGGRYRMQVIDILENPLAGETDQILATPTVVRRLPLPARRVVGDLSQTGKVLAWLDIGPAKGG